MASPLLFILLSFCCRTRTRTRDAESTVRLFSYLDIIQIAFIIPRRVGSSSSSSNFVSRLLAPPRPAPVVDHQTLGERLAGIDLAKEGCVLLLEDGALVLALAVFYAPRKRHDDKPPPAGAHHDPPARALAGEQSPPQSLRGHAWLLARGLSRVLAEAATISAFSDLIPRLRVCRVGGGNGKAPASASAWFGESGSEVFVDEEIKITLLLGEHLRIGSNGSTSVYAVM
ncbi:hypothetical protein DFH09DRAFT_1283086 [Mycena vulgaris]|nr:hypothetical protein DFH09DRAFT_1283086 [Mycena vulgaris]